MRSIMPEKGQSWEQLESQLEAFRKDDIDWRSGRLALYVFNAGQDVAEVAKRAYDMYISENGLGMRAFPSLKIMEDQILGVGLDLLNTPEDGGGALTSGGTESIFLAVKTCRDYWRAQGRDVAKGEILVPATAHPAFNRAAEYLGLTVVRVPARADHSADPDAMAAAINPNSLMLVGSAPNFPFGIIDPIEELSVIALRHDLWLHVDACVGGYFAPFARMNGLNLPGFDFTVEGVRSMSADLHKYGYAAKGASTVFYRDGAMLEYQRFEFSDWPAGAMVTSTFTGTRPGGAIAAAWAVLHYLGREGYQKKVADVIAARRQLEAGLKRLGGFRLHGNPQLGIICFDHEKADILAVGEHMLNKGWLSARTQKPKGLHLMLSPIHLTVMDDYLADLDTAVQTVLKSGELAQDGQGFYS